ncbi:MAG: serine/threonine-protein kinase [Proteobacteria bacterium]|nr:serine/threonine-protein kinase [Pseudomonadota bacterium]
MSDHSESDTRDDGPFGECGLRRHKPQRDSVVSRLDQALLEWRMFKRPLEHICIGRFILLECIGSGGMGDVFSAYDGELDRKVAIKLVRGGKGATAEANERLRREAKALAQLSHPNIVHVYEVGPFADRMYIAMEYVRGKTLGRWLQKNARDTSGRVRPDAVLEQFIAVGRGLAAAHSADLVHRDFKPDNVLVGEDGRPRVVDFGLARLMADSDGMASVSFDEHAPTLGSRNISTPGQSEAISGVPPFRQAAHGLTTEGHIMGTPAYMSPEQLRSEMADARSDQFSFCVALYEALYGQPPFDADDVEPRLRSIERGPTPSAGPASKRISPPVRKALVRGLQADPNQRFPDMTALLDALTEWPKKRRRRVTGGLAITLVGTAALVYAMAGDTNDVCTAAASAIDDVWNNDTRGMIENAFAASGAPFVDITWTSVAVGLDEYAETWRARRQQACQATRLDMDGLRSRRLACLDNTKARLRGVVEALASADRAMVEAAMEVIAQLPDVRACGDDAALRLGAAPPPAAVAKRVRDIRQNLQRIQSDAVGGHYEKAIREASAGVDDAKASGYEPVHAEALATLGLALIHGGTAQHVERGEDALRRASWLAERSRHDALVAVTRKDLLLSAVRHRGNTVLGRTRFQDALAAIDRIGSPPVLISVVEHYRVLLALRDHQFDEAIQHARNAVDRMDRFAATAARTSRWPHAYAQALVYHGLGIALRESRLFGQARAAFDRARALLAQVVGSKHPRMLNLDSDLALLLLHTGDIDEADRILAEVARARQHSLGDVHRRVAAAHVALAEVRRARGQVRRADALTTRAIAALERAYRPRYHELALAYTARGAARYRLGEYDAAVADYRGAIAINREHLGKHHIEVELGRMNEAEALWAMGQQDQARAIIEEVETRLRERRQWSGVIEAFGSGIRGRIELSRRDIDAAVLSLDTAVRGLQGHGEMRIEYADVAWHLAEALGIQAGGNEDPRRNALYRAACALFVEQGDEVRLPPGAAKGCAAEDPAAP